MYRQLMANLERDEQAKRAQRGSASESSPRDHGGLGGPL
jgi:hypothetical protein